MSSGQGDLGGLPRGDAQSFFDAVAPFYDRVYAIDGAAHRARMAALRDVLGAPTEVLVLGVGTGRELPTLLDAGFRPTGLDCSDEMLAICARRARCGVLVRGNFWTPLAFADGAFGAAVALHGTLAHPPDGAALANFAREVARVIRPSGRLVLELPTLGWFERWSQVRDAAPGVLVLDGPAAAFVDRRSGAAIAGLVVSPDDWCVALSNEFVCRVHPMGDDEVRIVAERKPLP
jgi:SAM-dependent methyltransferase